MAFCIVGRYLEKNPIGGFLVVENGALQTIIILKSEVFSMEEKELFDLFDREDKDVLADASAFENGEMTMEQLKDDPKDVEGDEAVFVNALHILYGESSHDDIVSAFDSLKELAQRNHLLSNTLLGVLYAEGGEGYDINIKLSESYLKRAYELGGVTAEYRLGILYLQDNEIRNPQLGVEYVKSAAKKGLKEALNSMGDIYHKGIVVEKNDELARKYYVLAAERKLGQALHNLALLAREDGDESLAAKYDEKASLYGYNLRDRTQNYVLLAFNK